MTSLALKVLILQSMLVFVAGSALGTVAAALVAFIFTVTNIVLTWNHWKP